MKWSELLKKQDRNGLMYQQVLAAADKQQAEQQKAESSSRGTKRYTIKSKFGEIKIDRIRLTDKNGVTSVPASQVWETP